MARSKKKSGKKKSAGKKKSRARVAVVLHKELLALGEVERMYRETVAWLRHLAAALRHGLARAGAAVACNAALILNQVGYGVPWNRERSDVVSASNSVPRLTPRPETPPPLEGADNFASASPPPTGFNNHASVPARHTGASNLASGSQASGSASVAASNSDSSGAKNSGSGSQASGSGPGPASKADSAPRLAKRATLSPPTGAKSTQRASIKAHGFATNRGLNQEPFSGDYHLSLLFEDDECVVEEDDALMYARFCFKRANSLQNKKDREICHICFFEYDGKVTPCWKDKVEDHCQGLHKNGTFLCEKQGCYIRTSSSQEAGRHHYFCHEKYQGWWVDCLKRHGEM